MKWYEDYIKYLSKRFNIEEYTSDLNFELWKIINDLKLDKFKDKDYVDFFIKRCLKNYAINLFKKHIKNKIILYNNEILNIEADKLSTSKEIDIITNINFYEIIKNLSTLQNKIIVLRYDKCFSDKEIADLLGISRQAVFKNRKQALEFLKQHLKECL